MKRRWPKDKMKFLRLDDLPFDERDLTPVEQEQLERALEGSPELRSEHSAWKAIEMSFKEAPLAEPAAGFADRWRRRVLQQRQRRNERQVKLVLGTLLGGALVALMLLGLYLLDSPADFVAAWMEFAIRASQVIEAGVRFLTLFEGRLPIFVGGLLVSAALAWLSLLWIAAIYRLTFTNVPNGVTE